MIINKLPDDFYKIESHSHKKQYFVYLKPCQETATKIEVFVNKPHQFFLFRWISQLIWGERYAPIYLQCQQEPLFIKIDQLSKAIGISKPAIQKSVQANQNSVAGLIQAYADLKETNLQNVRDITNAKRNTDLFKMISQLQLYCQNDVLKYFNTYSHLLIELSSYRFSDSNGLIEKAYKDLTFRAFLKRLSFLNQESSLYKILKDNHLFDLLKDLDSVDLDWILTNLDQNLLPVTIYLELAKELLPQLLKRLQKNNQVLKVVINQISKSHLITTSKQELLEQLANCPEDQILPVSQEISTKICPEEAINAIQKNLIEGTLRFTFNDIQSIYPASIALKAIEFINKKDELIEEEQVFLEEYDLLEGIDFIRKILMHPCPQNRAVGDPTTGFEDGIKEGRVYFWRNGFGTGAISEPQGLLGLSGRNDTSALPITREATIYYINQLINEEKAMLEEKNKKEQL